MVDKELAEEAVEEEAQAAAPEVEPAEAEAPPAEPEVQETV